MLLPLIVRGGINLLFRKLIWCGITREGLSDLKGGISVQTQWEFLLSKGWGFMMKRKLFSVMVIHHFFEKRSNVGAESYGFSRFSWLESEWKFPVRTPVSRLAELRGPAGEWWMMLKKVRRLVCQFSLARRCCDCWFAQEVRGGVADGVWGRNKRWLIKGECGFIAERISAI